MQSTKNILFITADQWRAECLSSMGHPVVKTPNLDSLASDGITFTNHYVQCIKCGPSRASMLTGMYLQNHRSVRNGTPLDSRHTNIAIEARKAGYDPGLIGYTDTSHDPTQHDPEDPVLKSYHGVMPGFTSISGKTMAGVPIKWLHWLKEKGYEIPDKVTAIFDPVRDYPGVKERGMTYAPTKFTKEESDTYFKTDETLKYIKENSDHPWFLHLSYGRPHPPYFAPEPYNKLYDLNEIPEIVGAESPEEEAKQHPYISFLLNQQKNKMLFGKHPVERSEKARKQLKATFYGIMTEVDNNIGRILNYLKEIKQYENTLIIFTSDHGDQLWDHWYLGKSPYFDQGFHVPLIIYDPINQGKTEKGRKITNFTESIDIMPTVMDFLDLEKPIQCDGYSLKTFIEGNTPKDWRNEVHWEIDFRDVENREAEKELGIRFDQCCINVIRDNKYKYVHFPTLPSVFFDLSIDPEEKNNVIDDPEYRDIILEYAQKMLSWRMLNDERKLTGMKVGPKGVISLKRSEW